MTTTTVEVERTVTEEEELTLCEECQREVDKNGDAFLKEDEVVETLDGTGIAPREDFNIRERLDEPTELHFCSECLDKLTDGEIQPEYIERADEWLGAERKTGVGTDTVRSSVDACQSMLQFTTRAGGIIGIALLVTAVIPAAPTIPAWVFGLYGAGGLLALLIASEGANDALRTVRKADEKIENRND